MTFHKYCISFGKMEIELRQLNTAIVYRLFLLSYFKSKRDQCPSTRKGKMYINTYFHVSTIPVTNVLKDSNSNINCKNIKF